MTEWLLRKLRKPVFFLLSGRRHLGGDIWKEASGRHLGGFRRLSGSSLGNSLGAGAAMGASRASWTENAANSLCFTTKMRTKTEKLQFRLGFLGVGVTIVCVLQHFSADAEPERPCVSPRWSLRDAARNPTVKALFG